MNNIVEAQNLSKTFCQGRNKIEAVRNVHLAVEKGASVAIIGPSGAGKSTLLHLLGGLDTPTSGEVIFEDKDLYSLSQRERAKIRNRKIGFVFQFYHLLPEFTVLENVIMPALIGTENRPSTWFGFAHLRSLGTGKPSLDLVRLRSPQVARDRQTENRKRAELLLGRMDLSHRLNHKPRELSGGEAQRAAIARALINEPDMLLCDEPTGNLDSNLGEQIYGIIYQMSKEKNMTLVTVTHQEDRFFEFDKTYYIKDGRLSEKERIHWT